MARVYSRSPRGENRQVAIGDVVLVRSGERIGVDGVITQGSATLNQAAMTGESLPVDRREGDEVLAGTLNEVGHSMQG